MNRREFMKASLFSMGAVTAGSMSSWAQEAADKKKNVLFLGVDDLRCNLGCYGDPVAVTPNIDKLAKRGTLFTHSYVQQAVCSASRASFLTGCRPRSTTVDYPYNEYFLQKFLPQHPSLPMYFSKLGYKVRCGGKIHHQGQELKSMGFEKEWWGNDGWMGYADPENNARQKDKNRKPPAWEYLDVEDTSYRDGRLAEAVVDALKNNAIEDGPFFYAAGFYKPHLPFTAPKRYWDLYDRKVFKLPENRKLADDVPAYARASFEMPAYSKGQIDLEDEERLRLLTHAYYACTSFTDANIGKIIDELDRQGLADNTIIVLWSDHGFHLGENASFGKHTCFEVATRSPLIVSAPGFAAGQTSERLTEYIDIFPTVCELAGQPMPAYLEGRSLLPLLENPEAEFKTEAFSQYPRGKDLEGYSIRTERYRYTEWRKKEGDTPGDVIGRELYDHESNPSESENIVAEHPQLASQLADRLKQIWSNK
jgi:iduronate 2-sulfatase